VNVDRAAAGSLKEAALLRCAADLIRRDGYNPSKPADSGPGHSLSSALCTVTGCDPGAGHIPDCEDLHGRVVGYLYLTGRAWSAQSYLPTVIQNWEGYRPREGWRTQAEAADVLDHAGAVLTRAGHQPADAVPVTERETRGSLEAMLREFQGRFPPAAPIRATPLTDPGLRELRRLLDEEVSELHEGGGPAAIGKEAADVIYAAAGTAVAAGVPIDLILAAVHAANMTKDPGPDGKAVKGPGYRTADIAGVVGQTWP
jgi:Phosphoribosyl-ATP pyrophosphohydrolase